MSLAPEERLILACVQPDDAACRASIAALLGEPLDWSRLVALAEEQSVLPSVARRLTEGSAPLPTEVSHELRVRRREQARANLQWTGALIAALDALAAAGVAALPFKGPTLALQAYGDLGMRSFADLDVLVRLGDLPAARAALVRLGYRPSYPVSPARRALLVRRGSHESFETEDGSAIELHWRVAAPVADFGLDYERLWERLGQVEVAERVIPALQTGDLLLVLALHGAKHAWERLGWICDVAELIRRHPDFDWDSALERATRMRCGRVLRLALHLAADLLRAPLPPSVVTLVRQDPALPSLAEHVRESLFLPPRSGAGTFGFHFRSREGWRDRIALAMGSLTALNQHDLQLIDLPDAALPLYYLTRPLRLTGKAIAHALRRRVE